MRQLLKAFNVALDAFYTFLADDGWAIASHIALSALMALFPFLIVITSLAGFFGSKDLADQAAELMLDTWPSQVADALSGEIHNVLTQSHGGVLTIGVVLAIYFASNGVESLRVGLNRAYGVVEPRSWYWLRLESIGYTMVAAVMSLAMAFLIVLGPLILATARRYVPLRVEPNEDLFNIVRYGLTIIALIAALIILHKWLPAGTRKMREIMPGIVVTMIGSLVSRRGVRPVPCTLRQQLCDDLCRSRVGHDRAGVFVFHRRDFRLRRRTQRLHRQGARAQSVFKRSGNRFA